MRINRKYTHINCKLCVPINCKYTKLHIVDAIIVTAVIDFSFDVHRIYGNAETVVKIDELRVVGFKQSFISFTNPDLSQTRFFKTSSAVNLICE